jgi:hypothetical protein
MVFMEKVVKKLKRNSLYLKIFLLIKKNIPMIKIKCKGCTFKCNIFERIEWEKENRVQNTVVFHMKHG